MTSMPLRYGLFLALLTNLTQSRPSVSSDSNGEPPEGKALTQSPMKRSVLLRRAIVRGITFLKSKEGCVTRNCLRPSRKEIMLCR